MRATHDSPANAEHAARKARKNLRKSIVNYERDFPKWRGYVSKFHAITNRYGE